MPLYIPASSLQPAAAIDLQPGQVFMRPSGYATRPELAVRIDWAVAGESEPQAALLTLTEWRESAPLEAFTVTRFSGLVLPGRARLEVDVTSGVIESGRHGAYAFSGRLHTSISRESRFRGDLTIDPVAWREARPDSLETATFGWRIVLDDGAQRSEPLVLAEGAVFAEARP